jgi:adenine-specific DNA-methyltransferase
MPRRRNTNSNPETPVTDFRYPTEQRKDIPPAGVGIQGRIQEEARIRYDYDPHRPPVLRFNEEISRHKALLEKATKTSLTHEEAAELAALLESPQPWLEWAGKRENPAFEVDPVALHIHERVSAQAILKAVRREDTQRDLFGDNSPAEATARSYYQHDVDWANRLILGDSLQVMTSLARREGLAGKVQMIYIDPPYGIKFSSNWQNEVGDLDVGDKDEDLSREPEMIRAYRDTWTLGVHSYLMYLKQRLIAAHELLTDSGSVFVQIGEVNLHRVRCLLDEVFGEENMLSNITLLKSTGVIQKSDSLHGSIDYILHYAKFREKVKFKALFKRKSESTESSFNKFVTADGDVISGFIPGAVRAKFDNLKKQGPGSKYDISHNGRVFNAGNLWWGFSKESMARLQRAGRIAATDDNLYRVVLESDYPATRISKLWDDLANTPDQLYVVQTNDKVISRCILMSTDPGDLVLDPTCGSGTTAYASEQYGRRWVTIDTSRVSVSVARQRILTGCFEAFKTKDPISGVDPNQPQNPKFGFAYRTVPHITLKSIAQIKALDSICEKHEPSVVASLEKLNRELFSIKEDLREKLVEKLIAKIRNSTDKLNDADKRRWLLPGTRQSIIVPQRGGPSASQVKKLRQAIPVGDGWQDWEAPFDSDPDWPRSLQDALIAYRSARLAKMDELNAAIAANAEMEELVDQPEIVRDVLRVAGPFTVESVRPMEESPADEYAEESPIGGAPEELEAGFENRATTSANAASHIDRMVALMRSDGVTFLGNKHVRFARLDPLDSPVIHAEGEVGQEGSEPRRVAVVVGPEVGSMPRITAEEAIEFAKARRYDEVILAAFSFDAAAQAHVHDQDEKRRIRLEGKWKPEDVGPQISMALIRPDVVLGDLLKGNKAGESSRREQLSQQIFTVFGQPRTRLQALEDGLYQVEMEGVDIYDPVTNAIIPTNADKVAAWFLDTDYDGRTFCICQAFFPDNDAWAKLASALKAEIPEETWEALSGTESLPFHLGDQRCIAVKVIDPRGNEVIRVHRVKG